MDFQGGLATAWHTAASFAPRLLISLAILVLGYFVARMLAKAFDRVLERVGFDRLVERGGVEQVLARTPYDASDLMSRLFFYTLFLFVLQLAFGVFAPNPVSSLLSGVIAFLPRLAVAVLIIVVATAIAKAVKDILDSFLAAASYGRFVANAASIAVVTIGVFAALSEVGIAPAIVNALFYAMLAVLVGSAVVAIGGGGIAPMRSEWEGALGRLQADGPRIRGEGQSVADRPEAASSSWENRGPGNGLGQPPQASRH